MRKRNMRISLRAMTLSSAVLWGGAMLFVGLIHLAVPSYEGDFLRMMSSVYPGADTAPKLGRVLLGTLYGFVDGGIAGLLVGWLYSAFDGGTRAVSK
jgi:hypothetical protein